MKRGVRRGEAAAHQAERNGADVTVSEAPLPLRTERFLWRFEGRSVELPYDIVGNGPDALLLPALSSIASREEMHPLAQHLAGRFRCVVPDWPGFGNAPRTSLPLTPAMLRSFLRAFLDESVRAPAIAVAAGHAALYLVEAARDDASRLERIVLVAPTWRGPLPTAMGEHRRPLYGRLRRLIEAPVVGSLLYRANVSAPVVARMLRAHVYADAARVDATTLAAKLAVTRQRRARFGTAAFVTGDLDPVQSRTAFLAMFEGTLPPVLVLRPASTPPKSAAEIDALIASGSTRSTEIPGALAAHEEHPEIVAAATLSFIDGT